MNDFGKEQKEAQELRWMGIVLRRADTVPIVEKRQIEERLNMYDDLFEKDPKMQRILAERKAEGRAEGEAKGEARGKAEGLQLALVTVIEERFPPLAELVQDKITRIDKPDALRLLLKGIAAAPDEASARLLLELLVA